MLVGRTIFSLTLSTRRANPSQENLKGSEFLHSSVTIQTKIIVIHGSSDEGDYRSLTIEGGGVYFLWGVGVEVFSTNFQFFLIGFFPAAQNSSQDRDFRGFAKKS